ncbi:hypothetical protein EOI86_17100 [Hwanghaeella grinnelliae]|uniref:Uncharacterized protein n=1 Tax=Hwanghaeella grinnelliae TaxID=2500179 RepID=A0A3S3ULU9_9PROT|nr:hypothetical protein [Hwanghaeella grinnelliae]RVU34583.1 hypothetical protein EOI86_17100 [Hwanghaeella grinnelliae]
MKARLTLWSRKAWRKAVGPISFGISCAVAVFLLAMAFMPSTATAAEPAWHRAGGFEFSDRLGGFHILSVTGAGTVDDPIVIDQDLNGLGPFVITIRNARLAGSVAAAPILRLWVVCRVRNVAAGVWVGFDVELQEELRRPSDYWDGLSFDQTRAVDRSAFHSDRFLVGERISEPHDRVRFKNGHVNSGGAVQFHFIITDMTPRDEFYLLQEPVLLFSLFPQSVPQSLSRIRG